jgi:excinuclease ABC subunit A
MPSSEKRNEICIYSAETNNLKSISCKIPKNQFVVITGPSGSGKSSLVFDTIAEEAFKKLNLYISLSEDLHQRASSKTTKAKVKLITGLPLTISFPKRSNSKLSSVATASGLYPPLYSLFSQLGVAHCLKCGEELGTNRRDEIVEKLQNSKAENITILSPLEFSKNNIAEALQELWQQGFTQALIDGQRISMEELLDKKSLPENKILVLIDSFSTKNAGKSRIIESVLLALKVGNGRLEAIIKASGNEQTLTFSEIKFCTTCKLEQPELTEQDFIYYSKTGICSDCFGLDQYCPACAGTRLNIIAGNYQLSGRSFKELLKENIYLFEAWLTKLTGELEGKTNLQSVLDLMKSSTTALVDLGLGYLNLNRGLNSVSSGELQRILLAKVLGMPLTGHLTLLDEPTNGLHPKDIDALGSIVKKFKEKKNSIIAIEHDPRFIKKADYLLELGPKGGKHGGKIMAQGNLTEIVSAKDQQWPLNTRKELNKNSKKLKVSGAKLNTLKNLNLEIPLSALVSVVGVYWSGKSSFVIENIAP